MLTRCPQCETIFKVSKKHISAAKGLVRCGNCKDVFNAKEHVIKSKKDLKKPAADTKPDTPVATTAKIKDNKNIENKPSAKNEVDNSAPDSFDFIKDGFISSGAYKKFDATTPTQGNKPKSKAEALEQGKATTLNFDSVFEDESPNESSKDVFIVKKPANPKNNEISNKDTTDPVTFKSKTPKPLQSTTIKETPEKTSNKAGSFISQNVIDIKNAFSSISKKISNKVASKIQPVRQSDELVKKSLENKLNKSKLANQIAPAITETNISVTAPVIDKTAKKPAVMSIDSATDIFNPNKNKAAVKTPTSKISNKIKKSSETVATADVKTLDKTLQKKSDTKIKQKQKIKEDEALKLAIQLKKIALKKTQLANNKKIIADKEKILNKKSTTEFSKAKQTSKPDLNIVNSKTAEKEHKSTQNTENETNLKLVDSDTDKKSDEAIKKTKQKNTTPASQTKEKPDDKKDSKLISKEEPNSDEEPDAVVNDDLVHIHMETGDIPMILRESLEELDLPTRSTEMTLFMMSGLIILCLGLLLQFTVFRSIEMQQNYPALKPLIAKVCKTFTCDYSGPRDIKKIQLINRDIRVHPNTKGALLISATIINNANYQQPYPSFSVKLSNLSGKTVAQRFFSPKDYLGKLSKKLLLMPPRQPIRVALEVVDPGKEAINFEFKFLSRKP